MPEILPSKGGKTGDVPDPSKPSTRLARASRSGRTVECEVSAGSSGGARQVIRHLLEGGDLVVELVVQRAARKSPLSWKSVARAIVRRRRSVTRVPAGGGASNTTVPPSERPAPSTTNPSLAASVPR